MAQSVMVLGTGSDVGKSIVTTALCRIYKRKGYRVAPFKAQNMSNNSYVTVEGGEIGRAQVVQAEAAGVLPSVHMNPVLLKPSSECGSQVVVQGEVSGDTGTHYEHGHKTRLKEAIMDSYSRLASDYELIVMEGAGSCCEMNLKDRDLVNLPIARAVGTKCILVADIDRGGVFAQIIGTHHLMSSEERDITRGFLINKFRGDPALFSSGVDFIEERTGKPVLGLVPFFQDIFVDPEDSVAVQEDKWSARPVRDNAVNVGVIKLPAISNFTDLEVLAGEADVVLNYLFRPGELTAEYDCIVVPGTKNVMQDALWLARSGWKKTIVEFSRAGGWIMGICGGYQLLGKKVRDPFGVESDCREVKGVGLLPVDTILEEVKTLGKVTGTCLMSGKRVGGYEIHMGRTRILEDRGSPFLRIHRPGKRKTWEDGWSVGKGKICGTYVHGILDSQGFRGEYLNTIRRAKGLEKRRPGRGRRARFNQYDRLADHFETHCKLEGLVDS